MTGDELLEQAKFADEANSTITNLLIGNTLLSKLLTVWPSVARHLPRPDFSQECPSETPPEYRTRWLWALVEPEPEPLWAELAGLPYAPHTRRAIDTLKHNGLVFPDGTMSKWAHRYLLVSVGLDPDTHQQ